MAAGSTYTPIATYSLSSAQSAVTFSSIPSTYTDLLLSYGVKTSTATDVLCRFNSDTGTNYSQSVLSGNGTAASAGRSSNQSRILLDSLGYPNNPAPNVCNVSFMNYSNTTTFKTCLIRAGNPASEGVDAIVGLWRSTSAISTIDIVTLSGGTTFVAGSIFTLYGIQAA